MMLMALTVSFCIDAKIKIERNQVDKVTKERVIETSWYSFSLNDKKTLPDIHVRFVYNRGLEYMEIRYILGENITINNNYKLHIEGDSKSKMSADAVYFVTSSIGGGSIDYIGCHTLGFASVYTADFSWFIDNKPHTLKIETSNRSLEVKLPKSVKKDLQKLYKTFFETVKKNYNKK